MLRGPTLSSRRTYRNYRTSPTSLARAGHAVKNLNSAAGRLAALRSGATQVPVDRVVCLECFRVVRTRVCGAMHAHSYCPAAAPTGAVLTDADYRVPTTTTKD